MKTLLWNVGRYLDKDEFAAIEAVKTDVAKGTRRLDAAAKTLLDGFVRAHPTADSGFEWQD